MLNRGNVIMDEVDSDTIICVLSMCRRGLVARQQGDGDDVRRRGSALDLRRPVLDAKNNGPFGYDSNRPDEASRRLENIKYILSL
jgi:hypothetical protein